MNDLKLGASHASTTERGTTLPRKRIRRLLPACAAFATLAFAGCGAAGLSESSTCKDFLAADPADQQSITQQLAGKFGKPDYATPLGMPEVPYYCASNPKTTLKEFFESAG